MPQTSSGAQYLDMEVDSFYFRMWLSTQILKTMPLRVWFLSMCVTQENSNCGTQSQSISLSWFIWPNKDIYWTVILRKPHEGKISVLLTIVRDLAKHLGCQRCSVNISV
jgi:hypothetical protein